MNDIGGVVTRVGDETVGEMWSLYDGRDVLNEIDPRFGDNIAHHIQAVIENDVFHVSANTDPKGDRSKAPQDQDPDMMVHVVKETDAGIVVRGAKYETASGYADQAFLKPTVGAWTNEQAVRLRGRLHRQDGRAGREAHRALGLRRTRQRRRLSARQQVRRSRLPDGARRRPDPLGGRVLLSPHASAAQYIRGTLHRYSAFPYTLRVLYVADMMIGAALWNARQTGLDKLQAVREKLADLVCYREGINAHLTASIAAGAEEPRRAADAAPVDALCRPRLRLLEPAADDAHRARTVRRPDLRHARTRPPSRRRGSGSWLEKFYSLNDNWQAEDRRKLLAFARDLLNSDYAGHRLTFIQFAQAPHFNHLAAVYNAFDFSGPLDFVRRAADLSDA